MTRETHTFFGRDGNRLTADVSGKAEDPPVVLLHGGGQTRHSWRTTLEVLGGSGWRAYSIDLRGHGDSEWAADRDYSLDAFVGDVLALSASLEESPTLVGASLGGIASLTAMGEHPDERVARALVLVDVAPRIEVEGGKRITAFMTEHRDDGFASLDEAADAIQRYNPQRAARADLSSLTKNLRRGADQRWYWHWDPSLFDGHFGLSDDTVEASIMIGKRMQRAAAAISEPTLLVRGRMSDILSEDGAQELLELIPHAQLTSVAGAGHMVAGDRNDRFNDEVVAFLEQEVRTKG